MQRKKWFFIMIALGLGLGAMGAPASAAPKAPPEAIRQAVAFEEATDVSLGRSGVFIPSSGYTGFVELARLEPGSRLPSRDLDFFQDWTEVSLTDRQGNEFQRVFGLVYVYFNLTRPDRRAWETGELGIYRYDPARRAWEACPTEVLVRTKNAPQGRLACIISEFGLYGLASER